MNCMPMKESEQSKYYNNNIEHAKFIHSLKNMLSKWNICRQTLQLCRIKNESREFNIS